MEEHWLSPFLEWMTQHPNWAALAIVIATALEGFFVLGLFIPGTVVMFGVGALVATGYLDLWVAILASAGGAMLGDSLSYALGRAYRDDLYSLKVARRFRDVLKRGEEFFRVWGSSSVLIGRFVGPVRPLLPAIAGTIGMRPRLFLLSDALAALLWAPVYMLPGLIIGASIGLAAEVATRLVVVLLVAVAASWFVAWGIGRLSNLLQHRAENWIHGLLNWSQHHRRLGLLGADLADPRQPETPGLLILGLLLLLTTWLLFSIMWGFGAPHNPTRIDALTWQLFQNLRTPWTDYLALALSKLGSWPVYLPVALATLISLFVLRGIRAAMHWVAALLFGCALAVGLQALVSVPDPRAYYLGEPAAGFVGGHIFAATVTYVFLPILIASRREAIHRQPLYAVVAVVIVLIALAHLYLGTLWLTLLVLGIGAALIWVALLTLGFRRHAAAPVPTRTVWLVSIITFANAAALNWGLTLAPDFAALNPPRPETTINSASWIETDYATLPAFRIDMEGRPGTPLNLQWSGDLQRIRASLLSAGWQPPKPLSATTALLWMTSEGSIANLPILPHAHDGRTQSLILHYPISDDAQWVLRLWDSGRRLQSNEKPLWLGNVSAQQTSTAAGLLRFPVTVRNFDTPLSFLRQRLDGLETYAVSHPSALKVSAARRLPFDWSGALLLVVGHRPAALLPDESTRPTQ